MSKEIKSPTAKQIISQASDPDYQINKLANAGCQLNKLANTIHKDAEEHGLWDDFREAMKQYEELPDSIRMRAVRYYSTTVVAGEVSELRNAAETKEDFAEEAADVIISMLSTAVELGIDIGAAVTNKMIVNHKRPHKHGKETCYELPTA